ncbi:MAG TPA: hypothetical protein PKL60_07880 [Anaerolineaceae bacterium]|nr:hypothetical protein [Anaerolineaceae bacterium]
MRRFTKDFELVTTVDEKGREKRSAEYKGSYFYFGVDAADYKRFRTLAWALIPVMIALQIGAGFVANRGMYQMYIAVPYVLCFFPLVYLSAGALRLPRETAHLRRDQAELTVERIKRSGTTLMICNGLVILAELVYLIFFNHGAKPGRELLFLSLVILTGGVNVSLRLKARAISVNAEE